MEHNVENESTLRFLRKEHKDWSEQKIKKEANKIWKNYIKTNKAKLDQDAIDDEKYFWECVSREFLFFDPND